MILRWRCDEMEIHGETYSCGRFPPRPIRRRITRALRVTRSFGDAACVDAGAGVHVRAHLLVDVYENPGVGVFVDAREEDT